MPCVLPQRMTFLYLMNISIPWASVGKEIFAKQTRDPKLNPHIKKKRSISGSVYSVPILEEWVFLKWDLPLRYNLLALSSNILFPRRMEALVVNTLCSSENLVTSVPAWLYIQTWPQRTVSLILISLVFLAALSSIIRHTDRSSLALKFFLFPMCVIFEALEMSIKSLPQEFSSTCLHLKNT